MWSTESVYKSDDKSFTKPRQLCHMSHHLGTIHSVRFSPNGRYLASGADDKIICIYQLDSNPPSHAASFGRRETFLGSERGWRTCLCFGENEG